MEVSAMGLGWYEREDYPRILEVMEDANKLPRTHDEFVKGFKNAENQMKSRGMKVVRVVIKPDEFLTWCRDRNLKVDAQARMRLGAEVARDAVVAQQKGRDGRG